MMVDGSNRVYVDHLDGWYDMYVQLPADITYVLTLPSDLKKMFTSVALTRSDNLDRSRGKDQIINKDEIIDIGSHL